MSVLFTTADKQASKRKNRLLDSDTSMREMFSAHTKAPLIPTTSNRADATCEIPPLCESFAHLENKSYCIDVAWFCCIFAMILPVICAFADAKFYKEPGGHFEIAYLCSLVYPSLFACLPGISVHLFCVFLLLYNRTRVGFYCYAFAMGALISSIEVRCTFGEKRWCVLIFGIGIILFVFGHVHLVRATLGWQTVSNPAFVAWHILTILFVIIGILGQYLGTWSQKTIFLDSGLVGVGFIMCTVASWHSLLPVRVAFVQLYKQ